MLKRSHLGVVTVLVAAAVVGGVVARPRSRPHLAADHPTAADRATTDANTTRLVASLLARSQFAHHPLDEQLASKLVTRYLEALDGTRSLFLESDVAELTGRPRELARATTEAGDTRLAQAIFKRYLERLDQQVTYDNELLRANQFDFTGQDVFTFDRKRAPRPRDLTEARALWRQALRSEVLDEKLSDEKQTTAAIAAKLLRRHQQRQSFMHGLHDDDVLAIYLDALAHVYDPHSDYLGHEEMQTFAIEMNLSVAGIGAALVSKDGVCTIHELIAGGPAARSGQLKPGDRITAVAQDRGTPVDVSEMPLTRIVQLIRGPKGSAVTLTLLPPAGSPGASRTVRLVRDEVKLEDQQAKMRIIDVPEPTGGHLRLAVVDLPSFYTDGGRDPKPTGGASRDVAKLLEKARAESVQGMVLDLRHNGGGSLEEAIRLTGLFLASGPIVETRDPKNDIQVNNDPDPRVAYDGPLLVLTSRFSASASEIAAGALQDYGRALIVGDSSTFGKGTVQTIFPLAPVMDENNLAHAYDPGGLKITIGKFYRPSGASTELRGVASDIVLPSRSDLARIGEAELEDPLPWDTIPAVPFQPVNRVAPYKAALTERSSRRMAGNRAFADLRQEFTTLKDRLASGRMTLNEAERRRELATTKRLDQEIAHDVRAATAQRTTYVITTRNASNAGLPAPEVAKSARHPDAGASTGDENDKESADSAAADDLVLNESLAILRDYVQLLQAKAPANAGAAKAR
jgi:carboxyl-terminal processing protease